MNTPGSNGKKPQPSGTPPQRPTANRPGVAPSSPPPGQPPVARRPAPMMPPGATPPVVPPRSAPTNFEWSEWNSQGAGTPAPAAGNGLAFEWVNLTPTDPQAAPAPPAASPAGAIARKGEDIVARKGVDLAQEMDGLQGIKDRVVLTLLRKGEITKEQVKEAQKQQQKGRSRDPLWRLLAEQKDTDPNTIFAEASRIYAFREATLGEGKPDKEFVKTVLDSFPDGKADRLIELKVLPFEYELEAKSGAIKLVFVTHDPTNAEIHRLMHDLNLERFELRYVPAHVVSDLIKELFPKRNVFLEKMESDPFAFDLGTEFESGQKQQLVDEDALEAEINRSMLINLFEAMLVEGVRKGVSDIHIYPGADKNVQIHMRLDGKLQVWHIEDKVHPEAFLAVVKDNALNVDRFERDRAQDGFIQRWVDDTLIRFRVSVLPIANANPDIRAESIVIRILDDRKVITDLSKLGLLPVAMQRFEQAIRQPHGMVILTGPTGSGKSTTLVAALYQTVTPDVNVLTVEDPVEYIIRGVRQIKLSHKLDLEGALRAILRHDPDVVMVGEMRDKATAELAIKLANTGHLTFSTLHTNDAPSAVSRLYKMGVEPFLIAYAINLVVAQRLIRTLCSECKQIDRQPDQKLLEFLGFSAEEVATTKFYKQGTNKQCRTCGGRGYKGRRAIAEALYFSPAIRHLIVEAGGKIDEDAIRETAEKEGMLTLAASAREVVKMGDTSIEEMMRMTASD